MLLAANLAEKCSGWWLGHPSEKYESQLGWLFPIYGNIKNVPNHQPVDILGIIVFLDIADVNHIFPSFLFQKPGGNTVLEFSGPNLQRSASQRSGKADPLNSPLPISKGCAAQPKTSAIVSGWNHDPSENFCENGQMSGAQRLADSYQPRPK